MLSTTVVVVFSPFSHRNISSTTDGTCQLSVERFPLVFILGHFLRKFRHFLVCAVTLSVQFLDTGLKQVIMW